MITREHAISSNFNDKLIILRGLNLKLDDSVFFRTQSYITEISYFEYLLSFRLQKKFFFPSAEQYNLA